MPLHSLALNRRQFVAGTIGAGLTILSFDPASAASHVDPNSMALLADTHIPGEKSTTARGVNMYDNLARVVKELVSADAKPAGVIIDGDCAYLRGESDDYRLLAELIEPLIDAQLPVHMALGNHDNRELFYNILSDYRPEDPPVAGKHVSLIRAPAVDWLLIDTLLQVNVVTGEVGEAQLRWLSRTLSHFTEKPIVVVGHHNPQVASAQKNISGIKDTEALFELLDRHGQVKAYVFGHTHNWHVAKRESGLHLINLPPVAYVFSKSRPSGWVQAQATADGMQLQLRSLDKQHAQHDQIVRLQWR